MTQTKIDCQYIKGDIPGKFETNSPPPPPSWSWYISIYTRIECWNIMGRAKLQPRLSLLLALSKAALAYSWNKIIQVSQVGFNHPKLTLNIACLGHVCTYFGIRIFVWVFLDKPTYLPTYIYIYIYISQISIEQPSVGLACSPNHTILHSSTQRLQASPINTTKHYIPCRCLESSILGQVHIHVPHV